MGLYTKLPDDLEEVDIIIAGGGTAGCIVAGRLAAADPNLSILVIEYGRDNYEDPMVVNPVMWKLNLVPAAKTTIYYIGDKAPQLADRNPIVPAGGMLGGGSSINVQMYTRAQRSDYDSWKTPGWSTDELIPYLKKLETYHGPGNDKTHGYHGPVHISNGGYTSKTIMEDMIQAAKTVGYPEIQDLQDLDSNNGVQRWLRNNSPEGRRQDTAHCYLHPLLQDGKHPNLHVLVQHKVLRILFDDEKRATGVEYTINPDYLSSIPLSKPETTHTIKARKLVVVSAGACGSPLILEQSGLGDPTILTNAGVPVIADLPGVGKDYQDHHLTIMAYRTSLPPGTTPDELYSGALSPQEVLEKKHEMRRWNTVDIAGKIRPTKEEVAALGPEFKAAWDRDFRDNPNRPLMLVACLAGLVGVDPTSAPPGQYISMVNYTAYPYSRGVIHINPPPSPSSPTTPSQPPYSFNLGFLTDSPALDILTLTWSYKTTRELVRRTPFYRGELPYPSHPAFSPDSPAALLSLPADTTLPAHLSLPPDAPIPNLVYTPEDDAAIEAWIRATVNTTWHSLGTAKMAPRESGGVVDAGLGVYGVTGLKVVDMSIVPENVGANTNNTAMVVGEKGADIIAGELGLRLGGRGELVTGEV